MQEPKLLVCCFVAMFFLAVFAVREQVDSKISAAMPRQQCLDSAYQRPCKKYDNSPISDYYPNDWPCPCPSIGDNSGSFVGKGKPSTANPYKNEFQIIELASGFNLPVDFAFAKNGNLFVTTKSGEVWKVNRSSGIKTLWLDLKSEVNDSGDRGLLGIALDPNYPDSPHVYLWYTYGRATDPGDYSATMTRLVRITEKDGVGDMSSYYILLGEDSADSVPICYNSHAVGSVKFGHDGSLIASVGESSHWEFEEGDYGQDVIASDTSCAQMFGNEQDIGSFRSQSLKSGGGKILRLDPRNGGGICPGNDKFIVYNPFCDGDTKSWASRTWALGVRQPFRMMVRPLLAGESVQGPGTIYFGDVGEGGYEEINVINAPGLNFGWPCWEGPLPMVKHRDSIYNINNASNVWKMDPKLLCPYIYETITTTMPFFFYSRYGPGSSAGNYGDNAYLGQNFVGNTIAGLAFYTGTNYPAVYRNSIFFLDYGLRSIGALAIESTGGSDIFNGLMDFKNDFSGAITTLDIEPQEGNLVYLDLFGGSLNMIKYAGVDNPPVAKANAYPTTGVAPLAVQFTADGSIDQLGDIIDDVLWDFGDGSAASNEFNPVHTYQISGVYTATLSISSGNGATTNASIIINTQFATPIVKITSPTNNKQLWHYNVGQLVSFAADIDSNVELSYMQFSWSATLSHVNHFHPDAYSASSSTFSTVLSNVGSEIPSDSVRVNLVISLSVADTRSGLVGYDTIFVAQTPGDWFENTPPEASFVVTTKSLATNNLIQFDASSTVDEEYDSIFYCWDFGDGLPPIRWYFNSGGFFNPMLITHAYNDTGAYTVTLTVTDNYMSSKSVSKIINIETRSPNSQQIPPVISQADNPVVERTPIGTSSKSANCATIASFNTSWQFWALIVFLCTYART